MPASFLDRIPTMTRESLKVLLRNARAKPDHPDAAAVIRAVEAELRPKSQPPRERARLTEAEREEIRVRWADKPVVDRIAAAFEDRPPTAAQLRRLRLVHDHPDLDEAELAVIAGDDGPGGFNLAMGTCARDRIEYLLLPERLPGYPPPNWSEAICDLRRRKDASGRVVHGWNLKPETIEALQRLGYLNR